MIVAIDGPAASGKSTVAALLAERLGVPLLNTGAMYRAVGVLCSKAGVDLADEAKCLACLDASELSLDANGRVLVDGQAVPVDGESVGSAASQVAVHPSVRQKLVELQQAFGAEHGCVAEGRDTTTVVFPDADLHVFLDASVEVRARRRAEQEGPGADYDALVREIRGRDQRDRGRKIAPLQPAEGALLLSSDHLTASELVEQIAAALHEVRNG